LESSEAKMEEKYALEMKTENNKNIQISISVSLVVNIF
jgi:hypothetical protein